MSHPYTEGRPASPAWPVLAGEDLMAAIRGLRRTCREHGTSLTYLTDAAIAKYLAHVGFDLDTAIEAALMRPRPLWALDLIGAPRST